MVAKQEIPDAGNDSLHSSRWAPSLREDATVTDPSVTRVHLRGYGRMVEIGGPPGALETMLRLLPNTLRPVPYDGPVDRRFTLPSESNESLIQAVLGDVELWFAAHARRFVFVHAAAVAVGGRGIVLPGRTRSGKTSLAAALVRAGADYYSDEYAVLGRDGRLRPYARPLVVRSSGGPTHVTVDELGGRAGRRPVHVGLVALLRHRDDANYGPTRLTAAQGILGLMENAVAARSRPEAVLTALTAVMTNAAVIRGDRGDADETAAALLADFSE
jgi:hypothetical protein